ncbi:DUF58 domain-containing protein [Candidatus Woesearchaeota archaeon]|nr:DUF58 domain-containing protein [Candidatus Woesearchaeota archaeon]
MPIKELKLELTPRFHKVKLKARIDVLNKVLEGNWNTLFKGQGLEFAGYRQYTYGDDASKIDWSASLRAHEILVRELEEYRNFNVFFLLDVSNSMLFSSTGKLKAEYGAELVHSLAFALLNNGDAIGLGMFSDRLTTKIIPNLGKGVFYRMTRQLSDPNNYGGEYNLPKVIQYITSFLQDRSVIIIVSDFIGLPEGWHSYLNILAGRYDVIGIMIRDPRDYEIPKISGQFLIEDPYGTGKIYIDSNQYKKRFEAEVKKEEDLLRSSFEKSKLGFVSLRTNQEFHEPILKYFKKRMALMRG